MSFLSKCIALLFLYISGAIAYPEFTNSSLAFAEDVPFNLNYSSEDFKFGSEFVSIFSDLEKNKLDKKSLALLIKSHDKTKTFLMIKPILDRMSSIIEIKDQDSFYSNCEIKTKKFNEATESIEDRMNLSLDKYCRFLFLKRMSQFSSNINLSTRDINYFKNASPYFISGENIPELVAFLKHFKYNFSEIDKISSAMIDKLIELKVRPSSSILTNLRVNQKFNQFLQTNMNLDESSTGYFQEEFQKTVREAQDAIDKNDMGQARQLAFGAVRFFNQNKNFISEKRAFVGIIIIAKAFYFKGKEKEAIDLFDQARSIAPKEEFSEANFYLLWPHIVDRDAKAMKKVIEKYSLEKEFDKFDAKLQYWIAYAEFKLGDSKKAQDYYNKMISNSPYSFYTLIALKDLAQATKGKQTEEEILAKLVGKSSGVDFTQDKFNSQLKDSLKRFAIWSKIGNERFQTLEIRYIQNLSKEDSFNDSNLIKSTTSQAHKEFITLNLLKLLNAKKRYVASFKVFQDSVEQNSLALNLKIIKQLFPLNYIDIVKKNSINIDPLIVISLIRQESAFNPDANSGVGAKGLMQLMPATAKRFNKKVKVKHLANPEINVALGTKYLRQLIARYDGNLIYALASYNAGESRIDRWRKEIFKSDDPLSTIESIPFEETRNYVKLIYRNYFFYNLIQNKSILKTPIEDSFKITQYSKAI